MSWPALLKAKDNIRSISDEVDKMLKEANSMSKKDLANYKETLLAEIDKSNEKILQQIIELKKNLKAHRQYLEAKSVFLRRHNKRL